jgi:hypothetical protein
VLVLFIDDLLLSDILFESCGLVVDCGERLDDDDEDEDEQELVAVLLKQLCALSVGLTDIISISYLFLLQFCAAIIFLSKNIDKEVKI